MPWPFHDDLFRILKARGPNAPGGTKVYMASNIMTDASAFIAWPATYDAFGLTTFPIGPDGTLYQKDLGPNAGRIAAAVARSDPHIRWEAVMISPE